MKQAKKQLKAEALVPRRRAWAGSFEGHERWQVLGGMYAQRSKAFDVNRFYLKTPLS